MDEPTANLDQGAISRLRGMLSELKAEGKTIVVSEHRLYYLAGLADEVRNHIRKAEGGYEDED